MDNGPFFGCVSACYSCGETANYCVTCWNKWILACEEQQRLHAHCPHCWTPIADETVQELMGRPYQQAHEPAPPTSPVAEVSFEGDDGDDTLSAMTALDYRRCPTCSTWMERARSGGDAIECLCGSRICGQCGENTTSCDCPQEFGLRFCPQVAASGAAPPTPTQKLETQDSMATACETDIVTPSSVATSCEAHTVTPAATTSETHTAAQSAVMANEEVRKRGPYYWAEQLVLRRDIK